MPAFDDFQEYRNKIVRADRIIIAHNLYPIVQRYRAMFPEEQQYELLHHANLTVESSTKLLHKLTLPPEVPDRDGMIAYPDKYCLLIKCLAKRLGEDVNSIAEEALYGTCFLPVTQHPEAHEQNVASEAHLIYSALQVAADRINSEFMLIQQCRIVDYIRQQREKPYWNHLRSTNELSSEPSWHEGEDELWWPFADGWLVTACTWRHEDGQDYYHYPINSFWLGPEDFHSIQGLCGVDFFFFPHIYLGPAENWAGERDPGAHDWIQEHLPGSEAPQVCWDESKQRYVLRQSEHQLPDGTTSTEYEYDDLMLEAARWLVIYPDPLLQKLVPAIFTLGTTCGGKLSPLTTRMIAEFGDDNHWEYLGKDAPTLLQRLKDLTGYRTGDFKVYDAWLETAERLHWNPILRQHPEIIEEIRYRKHLERWISQERPHSSEEDEED